MGFQNVSDAQNLNEYKRVTQLADSLFSARNYLDAKAYYQYALRLSPQNAASKDRLMECIQIMRGQSDEREVYTSFIINADQFYKSKNLEKASSAYQSASRLFPTENYPKAQIEKIKIEIEEQYIINNEYSEVIKAADAYLANDDFNNAKIEFQFALSLIPEKEYPKTKLKELEGFIKAESVKTNVYQKTLSTADSLFINKLYQPAKDYYQQANDIYAQKEYPQNQIVLIDAILNPIAEYDKIINDADNFYMVRDFQNAKNYYESASLMNAKDAYPKEMLSKVLEAIATKATTDQEDYDQAINLGNEYFQNNELAEAKQQFEFANRIKPEEEYSQLKIDELNIKMRTIQEDLRLDSVYNSAIQKADLLLSANDFKQARENYELALSIKTNEFYPTQKLKDIQNRVRKIEDEKNLETSYANTILKADDFFNKQQFEEAKSEFEYASSLKPNEDSPKNKILEIDSILNQIALQKSAEENYNQAIAKADQLFEELKFSSSQQAYKQALNYKPKEEYPLSQIKEIEHQLEIKQAEIQKAYELAISNAQNEMARGHLQVAKDYLNEAIEIKPEEAYAARTIEQIDVQIAKSKARALQQYEPLLQEADQYFKQKAYDRALNIYNQASALLPNEIYPKSRIKEILQIIEDATYVVLIDSSMNLDNNKMMQFDFNALEVKDRKHNFILLKLQNIEGIKNFKIILNFGKDKAKNGGLIVRLAENNESQNYLIRIGSQYKWFSEDNNWISVQPEGGRLGISEISFSKIN